MDYSCFIRLAISMALTMESKPLLPLLVPACYMACSMVSAVRTSNIIGIPLCMEVEAMPWSFHLLPCQSGANMRSYANITK